MRTIPPIGMSAGSLESCLDCGQPRYAGELHSCRYGNEYDEIITIRSINPSVPPIVGTRASIAAWAARMAPVWEYRNRLVACATPFSDGSVCGHRPHEHAFSRHHCNAIKDWTDDEALIYCCCWAYTKPAPLVVIP